MISLEESETAGDQHVPGKVEHRKADIRDVLCQCHDEQVGRGAGSGRHATDDRAETNRQEQFRRWNIVDTCNRHERQPDQYESYRRMDIGQLRHGIAAGPASWPACNNS